MMKTKQGTWRWAFPVAVLLLLTVVAPGFGAAEMLNFNRRASWPGYLMGPVEALYPNGSLVWIGVGDYAGASSGSLLALDIREPASPIVVSSTVTAGIPFGFENGFAYAYNNAAHLLEVYELTNPHQPVVRSRTSIPLGFYQSLMVRQGYVWVVNSEGVEAYDVRDPAAPKRAGGMFWDTSVAGAPPNPMVVCGDFGLVRTYASQSTALRVIDLRNPAQPVETGSRQFSENGFTDIFAPVGDYVYYVTYSTTGTPSLQAVKITSLGTIESTSVNLTFTSEPGHMSGINRMWGVGDYLYVDAVSYVPDSGSAGTPALRIIDATNRLQPTELTSSQILTTGSITKLTAAGGRVFFSCGINGEAVVVLDATNLAQPVEIGPLWRSWGGYGLLYGFVGNSDEPFWRVRDDGTGRFRLFKVSGLLEGATAPWREWEVPYSDSPDLQPRGALLYSNYCYVLSRMWQLSGITAWLDAFDLSAPGSAVHTSNQQIMQESGSPEGAIDKGSIYHTLKIVGDKLFMSYPSFLDIYSLSTPDSPQLIGHVSTPMWTGFSQYDLEVHSDYVFLWGLDPAYKLRLMVVDVRDPANPPAPVSVRQVSGNGGRMAFSGDLLYVSYYNATTSGTMLEVLTVTNPLSPILLSRTAVAPGKDYVFDAAILQPYALLAGNDGLLAVDISDPKQPKTLGVYAPFPNVENYRSPVFQVRTWQNHVFLQDQQSGIVALDLVRLLSSLTIQRWLPGTVRLSWEGAPGISLQRAGALSPAGWEPVANTDGQSQAIVPADGTAASFRLVRP